MSGMGGYGQKCEKMPKSLHLIAHIGAFPNKCTIKHPFLTTAT
jgi:hypothetical protein